MKLMSFIKKNNISKLHNDNRGMSMATVIVAIGFVLVLVSIILSTATVNFKMRNMNVFSKDSFYSAEQVLDELNIELQRAVQQCLSDAYIEVLTTYNDDELSSKDKNEIVKDKFYQGISESLGLTLSGSEALGYSYSTKKYVAMPVDSSKEVGLYKFIKTNKWDSAANYGAFLRGDKENASSPDADGNQVYTGDMLMYEKDGILLKNLYVYYKDANGFVSAIKTDIRIKYPGFRFSNPDMPQISDYAFITDTALEINGGDVNIIGNSYAYRVDADNANIYYRKSPTGPSTDIVATEISLNKSKLSTATEFGDLWVFDIFSDSSKIELSGNTYVRNDIEFQGKDNEFKMAGGRFYGYGNGMYGKSEDGSETENSFANYDSSAFLINGLVNKIDLRSAEKFVLAGRAYVDIYDPIVKINSRVKAKSPEKTDKPETVVFTDENGAELSKNKLIEDIYTGESIAVKSNQLIYLVPGECIVNKEGVPLGRNPITKAEYDEIKGDNLKSYIEVDQNALIEKLRNGDKLADYVKETEPVKRVFVRTSDGRDTVVYYYINFKNDIVANQYLSKYYQVNYESVNKYMKQYVKDNVLFPMVADEYGETVDSNKISMAGLSIAVTDNKKKTKENVISALPHGVDVNIYEQYDEDYHDRRDRFAGYYTRLSPRLNDLENQGYPERGQIGINEDDKNPLWPKDDKSLFDNYVIKNSFKEVATSSPKFKSKNKVRVLLINSESSDLIKVSECGINLDDCNLIVSNCDISLAGLTEFEGLIIARGKIIVPGNFTFKSNYKLVDECLNLADEDEIYRVYDIFEDSDELSFLTDEDDNVEPNVMMSEIVQFENWTKNINIK